jgi:molybdenum cofactor biosynthesis protein B
MSVERHRAESSTILGFAILTVSDTRTAETDVGGARLAGAVEAAGQRVVSRTIVADETLPIRAAVRALCAEAGVDVVLVTGGTGVAPRDVTVEAVAPLFEKELPGFGELFRMLSYAEIGAAAYLSRATAGVAAGRAVYVLPGSPAALDLAMTKLVLPEAGHLVAQARAPASGGR